MNCQGSFATDTFSDIGGTFLSTIREERRDPCEIEAYVVLPGTSDPVLCLIENISAGGAQIRVSESLDLPARCSLLIPLTLDRNEVRTCEVLWGEDGVIGVKFLGA